MQIYAQDTLIVENKIITSFISRQLYTVYRLKKKIHVRFRGTSNVCQQYRLGKYLRKFRVKAGEERMENWLFSFLYSKASTYSQQINGQKIQADVSKTHIIDQPIGTNYQSSSHQKNKSQDIDKIPYPTYHISKDF